MRHPQIIAQHGGHALETVTLESPEACVTLLNYGAITQDWRIAHENQQKPVILGYEDAQHYFTDPASLGVIAGRVANRTAQGRFTHNGLSYQLPVNQPPHHLHGGHQGLGKRFWTLEADSAQEAIELTYHSPDQEEGYPGAVDFRVAVRLQGSRLIYDLEARPDRPTPINLAQHTYYNLMGSGDIWAHQLQVDAEQYTPTDATLIPTGELASLQGTHFDFLQPQTLGAADPQRQGTDINLVLTTGRATTKPAAVLTAPSGVTLRLWTDQPGLQLYNAMHLQPFTGGLSGQSHDRFGGLCLEPQHFPDSLNHPAFPSIWVTPEQPYRQRLEVEITAT